jgi:hypothetical protein
MLAYCGRPAAAAFCDPSPYIDPRYARETIAEIRSLGVALATAIITQTGSHCVFLTIVTQDSRTLFQEHKLTCCSSTTSVTMDPLTEADLLT